MSDRRGSMKVALQHLAVVAGLTALYYLTPVGDGSNVARLGVAAGLFMLGVLVLVWAFGRHTIAVAHRDRRARLRTLLLLVYVVTGFFALGYLMVARIDPSQFAGLSTRTDALYFTLSTIATVGFGDVHATGQLARVLVSTQIIFDLVILASLVAAYRAALAREER
ncbi:ion channel [Nonomuraea sp. NPDC050790]|uniref:ion channel n=1 Tax=Nonomuraea sp. NPDC050790 TaxID=3364371 RepID=UPI00379CA5B1